MVEIVEEKQEQVPNDEGGFDWKRMEGTVPGFNRLPLAKVTCTVPIIYIC